MVQDRIPTLLNSWSGATQQQHGCGPDHSKVAFQPESVLSYPLQFQDTDPVICRLDTQNSQLLEIRQLVQTALQGHLQRIPLKGSGGG